MSPETVALLTLLMLGAALFGVNALVYAALDVPSLLRLRRMAACERNRNRFGELRTKMMKLARDGKIRVEGPYFPVLYRSLTTLMREPHEYAKAAEFILTLPPPATFPKGKKPEMTAQEAKLIVAYAVGLDRMCRDYSFAYRLYATAVDGERARKRDRLLRPMTGKENAPPWVRLCLDRSRNYDRLKPVLRAKTKLLELRSASFEQLA